MSVVVLAQRSPIHLRLCLRSLHDALRPTQAFAWDVTIVEGDGGGPGSLSRQAFLGSAALFAGARLLFNDSGERPTLAAATQRGAAGAWPRAEHIVFIQDSVEVSRSALERMIDVLERDCRVALVGAASAKPDGAVFHRGVAFDLGPRHKRCLSSDAYEDDYSYGSRREANEGSDEPLAWTSQAIWAFHAGQGLRAPAPPVAPPHAAHVRSDARDRGGQVASGAAATVVEAVSEGCVALRLAVWQDMGGLDPKVPSPSVRPYVHPVCSRAWRLTLHVRRTPPLRTGPRCAGVCGPEPTSAATLILRRPSGHVVGGSSCGHGIERLGGGVGGVQERQQKHWRVYRGGAAEWEDGRAMGLGVVLCAASARCADPGAVEHGVRRGRGACVCMLRMCMCHAHLICVAHGVRRGRGASAVYVYVYVAHTGDIAPCRFVD